MESRPIVSLLLMTVSVVFSAFVCCRSSSCLTKCEGINAFMSSSRYLLGSLAASIVSSNGFAEGWPRGVSRGSKRRAKGVYMPEPDAFGVIIIFECQFNLLIAGLRGVCRGERIRSGSF